MAKKNALGRGLDALITFNEGDTQGSSSISEVELHKIAPNPDQPRRSFDEEALQELAASIKSIGLVQPITLREIDEDSYEIIAGERRYRASLMAGLTSIPAYIKTADDDETMEMALIENIQREDLNSIEIALAYQKLINTLSLTQEQLSERVGKKRATVANYLRLLKLPAEVQMGVKDKKIDMGHARALVTMNDPVAQLSLYNVILQEGLSVRNVETIVREYSDGKQIEDIINPEGKSAKSENKKTKQKLPDDFEILKKHLSSYFETDVQFSYNKNGKGKITIPFNSSDELERIIVMFDKMK
ncbi:MAG TPA: ParB/RepB/Spo0J family partition protein [Fermentimonas caenicola]|jgi:ParB family chromosome partitioning protein|uniref:ParB/RepB/Spo0J family partition protein n=1 Tax=Lascolabacillus sp. TaxID=1924068 RepID=UPI0012093AF0|nr:ParB/RepB/Spo0J family partition protein [Lascolabacillus sp.]MBP6175253.1 ParB/RepB/Spo0J family partition protein [Fermentimonas sp.]MDI9625939.1 ParB/RepB/Spo0J family partition protein [Bacteroidota bacterium]TAH61469.1 MAG: ParB/RepB/Spo0J family partition protein [Fermentimonas caenicola]MBP7104192.1 ParB/RepB/Spo0J family partition protein [Fermentimonas sp.]MDD3657664.1 ParB/RepB/Spo0J family partition protein [Lascolabacillus sp.]